MNKLEQQEKTLIVRTLDLCKHSKRKAAKELGITIKELNEKIEKYNIGMHAAVDKALNDPSLSAADKKAIMDVFGNVESVSIKKKKKTTSRRPKYRKLTSVTTGKSYKQKYYDLLKKYKDIID